MWTRIKLWAGFFLRWARPFIEAWIVKQAGKILEKKLEKEEKLKQEKTEKTDG